MPVNVSRETELLFDRYEVLLQKWQNAINLVGPKTLETARERHIYDSLQLIDLIPADTKILFDFGSGAGFPGLVIAIARPDIDVTLVESDQRKCSFLQNVSRETNTPVTIINKRIEAAEFDKIPDVITARALAPLDELLNLSYRFAQLNPSLRMIFPKGIKAEKEIAKAQKHYDFEISQSQSLTDPEAVLLVISGLCKKA